MDFPYPKPDLTQKHTIPRLVIAAPASGSGKSTLTMGIIAALAAQFTVQGYKVGPDYIDPMYHTLASGRTARNLDTWMLPHDRVLATFAHAAQGADIAVIEGVMGLYDGYEGKSEVGSTAQVAKLLRAPVVLVIDVGATVRTAGAIALGLRDFDPDLNVAGVICNRVASERHAQWVTEAIEGVGIPVLGCVPRADALTLPERHLGIHTTVEDPARARAFIAGAAHAVRDALDMGQLEQITRSAPPVDVPSPPAPTARHTAPVTVAVARDKAFCFYYEDNLDALRAAGAQIAFFSPLADTALPPGTDGVYLGGGYPELYAAQLANNAPMLDALRDAVARGVPTYAECGGLMMLTEGITDEHGQFHALVGAVPGRAKMQARLTLGYRTVTAQRDTLLLKRGQTARGHEFHYAAWTPPDATTAYHITPRTGDTPTPSGYTHGNVLASFVHLHFGANPALAHNFIQSCQERETTSHA